ncbi:phosphotransferase [Celeribacter sp.]|uniref:phosphotransferase n=1 Tax=Celeribacter sp. TaxID=1890673 RepID=UPI003A93CDA5
MLCKADRDLVARDPGLPGLAALLDPEHVARLLGHPAELTYLRYKPGVNATATARCADGQFFVLRTAPEARFTDYLSRPNWRKHGIWDVAACLVALPVWRDRKIPAARKLRKADPDSLVTFKPNRRFVQRIDGGLRRAFAPGLFDQARAGAYLGEGFGGARLLASDAIKATLDIEWVAGRAADHSPSPELYRRIGARLADLHRHPMRGLCPLPATDPSRSLHDLADLLPDLAPRALHCAAMLSGHHAACRPKVAACHGDFSADQVIVTPDDAVCFIDWDRAGTGDPLCDVASFLARLDYDPSTRQDLSQAFLDGYGMTAEDIRPHRAAALAGLLIEPFRDRHPDWPERCAALLQRVEALLAPLGTPAFHIAQTPATVADALGWTPSEVQCLRLKPGRRAIFRYADTVGRAAYGKLRFGRADRRTPALQSAVRAAGLDGRHGVQVPAVLAEMKEACLWFQEEIKGPDLTCLLLNDTSEDVLRNALRQTGEALARLHTSGVEVARDWTLAQECAVLTQALAAEKARAPENISAFQAVERALAPDIARLETPAEPVLLHRDFYPDQVICSAGGVALLDLDLVAMGDPAVDLGNFLAHLDELALRHHKGLGTTAARDMAFLDGYAAHASLPDMSRITAARRISLARHIHISQRFPDRRHEAEEIIAHLKLNRAGFS